MSYSTFTSESVCAGHPDKVCDQISDAIVDAVLAQDPRGRIAVESAVTANRVMLFGEITTTAKIDFEAIARAEIKRLGYTDPSWGFSDQSEVNVYIGQQSPEIAQGVDAEGAGDQGLMFGYACRDTPELMPLPIALAHDLARAIDTARESKTLPYLRPDGKSQVTIRYEDGKPVAVEQVTIAVPHNPEITLEQVKTGVYAQIIVPVLKSRGFEIDIKDIIINGTGAWHIPGPASDAGLTGRKIVVDGYGGYARVGGGAFSGKDPTKVDRSGAYAARYIAKNIVAAGLADRVEVALAYAIGHPRPVHTAYETFGTATASEEDIRAFADKLLDTSVSSVLATLDLRKPIYNKAAAYGHFGQSNLPWEKVA